MLSQNNTVLTFYYDNKREEHNKSMSIGPFSEHDKRWGLFRLYESGFERLKDIRMLNFENDYRIVILF